MSELSPVRAELLGFLTHALLGDGLAAEYLILHLISTVYVLFLLGRRGLGCVEREQGGFRGFHHQVVHVFSVTKPNQRFC